MKEELRVSLYTPRFLLAIRSLIISRYSTISYGEDSPRLGSSHVLPNLGGEQSSQTC
ncbi:unnamed protein product [Prunus brigantina]